MLFRSVLKSQVQDKSAIAGLIKEMKEVPSFTPCYAISKVDRANNSVAHELAKLGRSICGPVILDSAPPCVVGLVDHD